MTDAKVYPMIGRQREAEPPADGLILTQSELATWMRDRRHWWLNYYRKLKPRYYRPYLPEVGTLVHAGLEAYYGKGIDPIERVQFRATNAIAANPDYAETIAEAAGLAGIMLEGYMQWLSDEGVDDELEVTGAEQKVEAALGNTGYFLRGKMDARAIDHRSGSRIQLEHKTVGSLDDIPKTAQSNFQFLTYDLLAFLEAQASGDETIRTDGVLLNMLRRVKRTARAKPPFYGRHEVRHNTQELRAHWRHVVALGKEIEHARALLDAGWDHHDVCPPTVSRDSSWQNPFLPVYALLDDGSDAEGMLEDQYEEHDPLERYETEGDE